MGVGLVLQPVVTDVVGRVAGTGHRAQDGGLQEFIFLRARDELRKALGRRRLELLVEALENGAQRLETLLTRRVMNTEECPALWITKSAAQTFATSMHSSMRRCASLCSRTLNSLMTPLSSKTAIVSFVSRSSVWRASRALRSVLKSS